MEHGPRTTDVLANERTFLAYLRTALSFVAFGFVAARFALFARELSSVLHFAPPKSQYSTLFGTAVAIFGALVAVYGGVRYVSADNALRTGRNASLPPLLAAAGAAIVALVGAAVSADLLLTATRVK